MNTLRQAVIATTLSTALGGLMVGFAPGASASGWYAYPFAANHNGDKFVCFSPARDAEGLAAYTDNTGGRNSTADVVKCPRDLLPVNLTI
jgi:hypothetical protein